MNKIYLCLNSIKLIFYVSIAITFFICSNVYSQQELKNNDTIVKNEVKFVPIPATEYTDINYHINIEKAKIQEQQNNIPINPIILPKSVSVSKRIEDYIKHRNTFPQNSVEYKQIQEKIDILSTKE